MLGGDKLKWETPDHDEEESKGLFIAENVSSGGEVRGWRASKGWCMLPLVSWFHSKPETSPRGKFRLEPCLFPLVQCQPFHGLAFSLNS
jgi:hypothetical protein